MYLSDKKIKELILAGELIIDPDGIKTQEEILDEIITSKSGINGAIQPASLDCRLGDHFLVEDPRDHERAVITLTEEPKYIDIYENNFTLHSHHFVLATTIEYFKLPPNIIAYVHGRSSIGRKGLIIHTAGLIDPGFEGAITLELYNTRTRPIKVTAGAHICQISFAYLDEPCEVPYGTDNKYQGQRSTVGTRFHLES